VSVETHSIAIRLLARFRAESFRFLGIARFPGRLAVSMVVGVAFVLLVFFQYLFLFQYLGQLDYDVLLSVALLDLHVIECSD